MRIIKLNHKGSTIMLTVFAMIFVLAMVVSYTLVVNSEIMTTRNQGYDAQVYYIAEIGLDHMLWRLFDSDGDIDDVSSTETQTFNAGNNTFSAGTYSYSVTVAEAANGQLTVDATGTNPDLSGTSFTKQVQLILDNLALSGTAVASSEAVGNPASQANDGNILSAWQAGAGGDQWIYIDLGVGTTYTVSRIMYNSDLAITRVETSTDALSWTAVSNSYSEPATPTLPENVYVVFDDVQCRYVRLFWQGAASAPWVYEFFIYARPETYDFSEDFTN